MENEEFRFKVQFGSKIMDAKVSVYWVDSYYLFIESRLQGVLMKRGGSWIFAASAGEEYCSDDILVLADIIKTNLS